MFVFLCSSQDELTYRSCFEKCGGHDSEDLKYFGVQNGKECWCLDKSDVDVWKYKSSTNCDSTCTGNVDKDCGGRLAMRIFKTKVVGE